MSAAIPTCEPTQLTAGDTWQWLVSFPDYVPSTHALSYAIAGRSALGWQSGYVAAKGNAYLVTVPTTATGLEGGVYLFQRFFTALSDGARTSCRLPSITVGGDPALFRPGDARPWQECALEAIEAHLGGTATRGMQMYTVPGGRQVMHYSIDELQKLRKSLIRELNLMARNGMPKTRLATFGPMQQTSFDAMRRGVLP